MSIERQSLDSIQKYVGSKRGLRGYGIVVGDTAQVARGEATHTADNFVAALVNGSAVLILNGTHTLVRAEDVTENDILIEGESPEAVLAFSTFTLTMSGASFYATLNTSGAGTGDIILSGSGGVWISMGDEALTTFNISNNNIVIAPGSAGGVKGAKNIPINLVRDIIGTTGNSGSGDDVLKQGTIQSDTLNKDSRGVRIYATGRMGIGNKTTVLRFQFGATSTLIATLNSDTAWSLEVHIYRTSSNTQSAYSTFIAHGGVVWINQLSFSETDSANIEAYIRGENTTDATNNAIFCQFLDINTLPFD